MPPSPASQGEPLYVGVNDADDVATANNIEQGYVVCPADRRFLLLFTFLKKNLKKKIMVFFSSCNSVKYHSELLNYIDIPVLDIHVRCGARAFFFPHAVACLVPISLVPTA